MNSNKRKWIKQELKMKKCKFCKTKENLTIDHIQPLSRGGTDKIKNLQCLCRRCNSLKSNLSNAEIRRIVKWWLEIKEFPFNEKKLTPKIIIPVTGIPFQDEIRKVAEENRKRHIPFMVRLIRYLTE